MAETQIKGLKQLSQALKELGAAAGGKALRSAVGVAMTPVMQEARRNVPVGTVEHKIHTGERVSPGFAKKSLRKRTRISRDKTRAVATVGLKGEAFYAVQFQEYSTYGRAPNKWLSNAMYRSRRTVERRLQEKLKENINKARLKNLNKART